MNLSRVQKKEKSYHLNNMTKIEQFNTKRGNKDYPRSHPQLWWQHVRLEVNILMNHIQLWWKIAWIRNWMWVIRIFISNLTCCHHSWGCDLGECSFPLYVLNCSIFVILLRWNVSPFFGTLCKFIYFNLSSIVSTLTIGPSWKLMMKR